MVSSRRPRWFVADRQEASSAYAKTLWSTAAEIGRNRVLAVGATLAAMLVAAWMLLRWKRDRRIRRRPFMAHRG